MFLLHVTVYNPVNVLVGREPLVGEAVASATGYTAGDDEQRSWPTTRGRRRSGWKGIVCGLGFTAYNI